MLFGARARAGPSSGDAQRTCASCLASLDEQRCGQVGQRLDAHLPTSAFQGLSAWTRSGGDWARYAADLASRIPGIAETLRGSHVRITETGNWNVRDSYAVPCPRERAYRSVLWCPRSGQVRGVAFPNPAQISSE